MLKYKKEKVLTITYYELSDKLQELIDKYSDERYRKEAFYTIDLADEFNFKCKTKEELEKYIIDNELETYFWKPAFDLYYALALEIIETQEYDFDKIMLHHTW